MQHEMSQHFLLSSKAKTLRLADVLRLSDAEAETAFCKIRWQDTQGAPVCPACGGLDAYKTGRPAMTARYRCKACRKDFTVTSGTLFASHKRPLRDYLAAIAIFCNEVKGKSALALSRDLGLAYKSAFVETTARQAGACFSTPRARRKRRGNETKTLACCVMRDQPRLCVGLPTLSLLSGKRGKLLVFGARFRLNDPK